MYHIFDIHSSVDGHSGCFHVLAVVNRPVLYLESAKFGLLFPVYPGTLEDLGSISLVEK